MSRHRLLKKFKTAPCPVLLGRIVSWREVDVPGAQLSTLLMMRLPFRVPNRTVVSGEERSSGQRREGGFLPPEPPGSVIKFKQGFGRLIRTKKDRGVVIVLDKRILNPMVKIFLSSIPGEVLSVSLDEMPEKIRSG